MANSDCGWIEMTYDEMDEIWDRFFEHFNFRPNEDRFPTIAEPVPSVTYSLLRDGQVDPNKIDSIILNAFRECCIAGERIAWIDWQHICFWLYPEKLKDFQVIANSLPWGDYSIFLDPKFTFGIYGEPHEHSMCIFGGELMSRITPKLDIVLERLREKI